MNPTEKKEVAVSDVIVRGNGCPSKNNAATVVLQYFGLTRQTVSPVKVLCKRKKKVSQVRMEVTHMVCFKILKITR